MDGPPNLRVSGNFRPKPAVVVQVEPEPAFGAVAGHRILEETLIPSNRLPPRLHSSIRDVLHVQEPADHHVVHRLSDAFVLQIFVNDSACSGVTTVVMGVRHTWVDDPCLCTVFVVQGRWEEPNFGAFFDTSYQDRSTASFKSVCEDNNCEVAQFSTPVWPNTLKTWNSLETKNFLRGASYTFIIRYEPRTCGGSNETDCSD